MKEVDGLTRSDIMEMPYWEFKQYEIIAKERIDARIAHNREQQRQAQANQAKQKSSQRRSQRRIRR